MSRTFAHAIGRTAREIAGDRLSVLAFGAKGDGTTDDTAAFQAAYDDAVANGGLDIWVPAAAPGQFYSVGRLNLDDDVPVAWEGEGYGTLIKRRGAITAGKGWWNSDGGKNLTFRRMRFDGAKTTPTPLQYGVDFQTAGSDDPLHAALTTNSTFWFHSGCMNIFFEDVFIEHTDGYAMLFDARTSDILNIELDRIRLNNCRPHRFGTNPADLNYGAWTGGILLHGNGATGNPYMVRSARIRSPRFNRVSGNCFWTHLYGFESLHEDIHVSDPKGRDIGLDFIQMGGVMGWSISNPVARRVGYTTVDDTSASVPKWLNGHWAVGLDHSGLCVGGSITGGSLVSCNGGYMDLDGLCQSTITGVTCRTPKSTDKEYTPDGIGVLGWGGSLVAGRDFAYGAQISNTSNNQGGEDVTISGCNFINLSGGAIRGYAARRCHFVGNNIYMPPVPAFVPLALGNIGSAATQRAANNVVTKNRFYYDPSVPAPCVFEDANGFAFDPADKNYVYDNIVDSPSGKAYEFQRDANTASTTAYRHSTNQAAATVRSEHSVERQGEASDDSSLLSWSLVENRSIWQHMRLQGYWKAGTRGPLLNVSEGGVGGVFATGARTTSGFSDCLITGKAYADAFMALSDTTYADADADVLGASVALLRFKSSVGYIEQSVAVSAGHRVWTPFGGGGSAGSDKQVIFNNSGALTGVANLTWDYGNDQLSVSTGTAGDRGILLGQHNNNIQAALMSFQKSRGSLAVPSAVASGDYCGVFFFNVYGATSGYINTASFGARINGAVTGTSVPQELFFSTSGGSADSNPYGSGHIRMLITPSGNVLVNNTTDDTTGAVLQVNGFLSAVNGYYTPSASTDAFKALSGGITAKVLISIRSDGDSGLVVSGTGATPRDWGFNAGTNGHLILRDRTGSQSVLDIDTSARATFLGLAAAASVSLTHGWFEANDTSNGGFISHAVSDRAINAVGGGVYAQLGLTTDQALYPKGYASSGSLNTPGAGYGGIAYKSGANYWFYNSSSATWLDIDVSALGGGVTSLGSLTGALNLSAGTGVSLSGSGNLTINIGQAVGTGNSPTFAAVTAGVINATATGASVAFQTASPFNFQVNGNGVVSCQQVNVAGNTVINSSGQFVGSAVSTAGAVQSTASGASIAFQTGSPFNFQVNGNGVVSCQQVNVAGVTVINGSRQFVGAGVLCQASGIGGGGFNPWNGSSYDTGQTGTIPIAGLTSITVRGGSVIGWT